MSPFTGKINGISFRIFSFSRSSSHHSCRVVSDNFRGTAAKTKQPREKGYLSITNLNDRFKSVRYAMENALLEPKELKKARKLESKQEKKRQEGHREK